MNSVKSKLIIKTFDGTMKKMSLLPNCADSRVEMEIAYYNDDDILTQAIIAFEQVIAVDFQINYFDNCVGSELFGFYEIYDISAKKELLEKIFKNRLDCFLYHGDYQYDEDDESDILNNKEKLNNILQRLDEYHLFSQQTEGGVMYIMAKKYCLLPK